MAEEANERESDRTFSFHISTVTRRSRSQRANKAKLLLMFHSRKVWNKVAVNGQDTLAADSYSLCQKQLG